MNYAERNQGTITFHKLLAFKESPAAYNEIYEKLNAVRDDKPNDNFIVGQAIEDFIFGNMKDYEIVARRSKDAEKIQLTKLQGETIKKAADDMNRNPFGAPKGEKTRISFDYRGHKIGGEIDELFIGDFKAKKQEFSGYISDYKSCASFDTFMKFKDQYIDQLSFYQFLVQCKYDIDALKLPGLVKVVTKDSWCPMTQVLIVMPVTLLERRKTWMANLDHLIEMKESKSFPELTFEDTLKFPLLYGARDQQDYIYLQ